LKQGEIRHTPIIGKKLNELDDECLSWGHTVLLEEGRRERRTEKENDKVIGN